MYISRTLESKILQYNKQFKVVALMGQRQIGKTTLLKNIAEKNRKYITLDEPDTLLLAKTDPKLFFEKNKPPLFIDEIQYAPELFPYIKMIVDENKKNGLFWLMGSQHFNLMKNVTESLAGRVCIIDMLGLSLYEIQQIARKQKPFLPSDNVSTNLKKTNLNKLYEIIWTGSFPEIIINKKIDRTRFYESYIKTYIERDVTQIVNVGKKLSFFKFLKVVAARTAQELNITDIARDTDIAPNTAKEWLSILQTSGIIYLLYPYFANITKRVIKTPKLYFTDTGLCSYLTAWNSPQVLENGAMSGAILETFVVMEILKSYWHNGKEPNMYYYRDKEKKEIDLIFDRGEGFYPVEIKKSMTINKDMIKNFSVLKNYKKEIKKGAVICLAKDWLPINKDVNAISLWNI